MNDLEAKKSSFIPKIVHTVFIFSVLNLFFVASIFSKNSKNSVENYVLYIMCTIALFSAFLLPGIIIGFIKSAAKKNDKKPNKFILNLIRLSLFESCAIIGFLCTYFSGDTNWIYFLGTVSLVCMIVTFPKGGNLG